MADDRNLVSPSPMVTLSLIFLRKEKMKAYNNLPKVHFPARLSTYYIDIDQFAVSYNFQRACSGTAHHVNPANQNSVSFDTEYTNCFISILYQMVQISINL